MKADSVGIQRRVAAQSVHSRQPSTTPKTPAKPETTGTSGPQDSSSISFPAKTRGVSPKLRDKWLSQTEKTGAEQAVIIGGGPAGLAAAITLAKRGVDVTVLELRADEKGEKPLHARPHQISLRQDALESLSELGAYDEVIGKSGFVQKESYIQKDDSGTQVQAKKPRPQTVNRDSSFINPKLLDTDAVSQVRISDVERALYTQAKEMGIKVKAGVNAELRKDGNSFAVTAHQVKPNKQGGFDKTGRSEDLGKPDLVVVADGAGSPIRDSLGIKMKDESAAKNYLGGHFQKGLGAVTNKAAVTESEGFTRHVMGTGHAQYDQTWVSVEVTPEEAALSPKERTALLAKKAQHVFPDQKVGVEDVGWGAGQLTTVQNRRAEVTTAGDNTVLIGDSAGTGSVWVGGGLNLALTTHLRALDTLVTNMRTRPDRQENNLKGYDKAVQWATSRWHKAGAAQLGPLPSSA